MNLCAIISNTIPLGYITNALAFRFNPNPCNANGNIISIITPTQKHIFKSFPSISPIPPFPVTFIKKYLHIFPWRYYICFLIVCQYFFIVFQ